MAKTSADTGDVTLLDEPADFCRPPVSRDSVARPRPGPASPSPSRRGDDRSGPAKADPEDDAEEPFLRAPRRVPVRRGLLPAWVRTTWGKVALVACLLVAPGVLLAAIIGVRSFLNHDPRFRIDSSASIQTFGNSQLTRSDLLAVFGSDIGRNLFFVPLAKRRLELERIPWVQKATVMRLLPNQLRVAIVERRPVAFVRVQGHVELADADGVLLTLTPQQMEARHYSFPVVSGINPGDPLSVRSARMQIYQSFISQLDSTGEHLSAQMSEVDLSDPDDVRATVPAKGSDLLLHFGDDDFLPRWHNYQAHIAQWEQQYPHLASVDLRYDHEVVLKMAGDPGSSAGPAPAAAPGPHPDTKPAPRPASAATTPPHSDTKPAPRSAASTPRATHTVPAQQKSPTRHAAKPQKPQRARHSPPAKAHKPADSRHPARRTAA